MFCSQLIFWLLTKTTNQTTKDVLHEAVHRLYHGTPYFQIASKEYTSESDFIYVHKKK